MSGRLASVVMPPTASRTPAVVLLSGGLDSATVLGFARSRGFDARPLVVDYGQRHRQELGAARRVAGQLGAPEPVTIRLGLRAIGGSALTGAIEVPKGRDPARASDIPATYVPARNLMFLSLAAAYGETTGARDLFIGVNAVDFSGYPDCRPAFIRSFERTVNLATKAGVESAEPCFRVHAPLMDLTKAQIIRLGVSLGVDYSLTHSCYDPDGEGRACGACDSCVVRARGFAEAGVPDPTRYQAGGGAA